MKKIKKESVKRIVIILGILVIPLMYSYFYLSAFWDPYSKLEDLPVAIVNNDSGAKINDVQRNIGSELQDKMVESKQLDFCFVEETAANSGLSDGKYYAVIVIPKEFSSDVSTASKEQKTAAKLIYMPNEKTNYLATQILNTAILQLTNEVKTSINSEVVTSLSDNLKEVPNKLDEINSGVTTLYNGANQLNDGVTTLKDGTKSLSLNYSKFNLAMSSLTSNVSELNTGAKKIDSGVNSLVEGTTKLENSTKELYKIDESIKALNTGTNTLNTSTSGYVAGVNAYMSQSTEIGQKIAAYVAANPSAMGDPNIQYIIGKLTDPNAVNQALALKVGGDKLTGATNYLNQNVGLLSSKTSDLSKVNAGINSLLSGTLEIKNGTAKLATGTESFKSGVNQLSTASNSIMTGINSLDSGALKLNDGSNKIKEGLKEANTKISTGNENTKLELKNLEGITKFTEEPVVLEKDRIESVPNYGTAFSSYFMSLSLWVGGLIIFVGIYLDADEKFKILSRHSNRKFVRTLIYLAIGIAQALLLAVVLRLGLKLQVENVAMYYLSCVIVSISFISIIQFFMINFKDAGKFIVILLLILQLTSCGGTFPMQLVPTFFNKLFAFMPMTYSVNLFKETISGGNLTIIMNNLIILSTVFVVFVGASIAGNKLRKKYGGNV